MNSDMVISQPRASDSLPRIEERRICAGIAGSPSEVECLEVLGWILKGSLARDSAMRTRSNSIQNKIIRKYITRSMIL